MGIRLKLLIPLLVLAALVLTGLKVLIWPGFLSTQLDQHIADEKKRVAILGTALVHPLRNSDIAQVYSILDNVLADHPNWRYLELHDAEGSQLYPLEHRKATRAEGLVEISHDIVFYTEPIGTLKVLTDLRPLYRQYEQFAFRADMLIVAVLLVAIVIAIYSQEKLIVAPLKSLAGAAQKISKGNFEAALPPAGNDEVGQLVRNFDEMRGSVQRYQDELHELAHHDALTQLPNRMMFMDRLEHGISLAHRTGKRLALLFLDLDAFKGINDTLGHSAGDQLLRSVACRLKQITREGDTVARLGGDEFMVIAESLQSPDEVAVIAQKILNAFQAPVSIDDRPISVTTSIGVTVFPDDAEVASELVQNADIAMYRAKAAGGGAFRFFSQQSEARELCGLEMRSELFYALERNRYFLVYQPRIDVESGSVDCLEALIRWRCSSGRVVGPGEFIPLLEQTGLIADVGEWVLRESCHFIQQQIRSGRKVVRVSVNLSSRQFRDPGLLARIHNALKHHEVPSQYLELELTEGSIMEDIDSSIRTLDALHDMGIRISIDDFGTGYSSLSYLKRFPVDYLKIDRSFVDGVPEDKDDIAIIQSIIALSRKLGIATIAEGVETEEQLRFLEDEGCDGVQGFLLSHPLPGEEALAWLSQHVAPEVSHQESGPGRLG